MKIISYVLCSLLLFDTTSYANECVVASHYHQGKYTTSGERMNANAMTAAHKTLPFGTLITVTNPYNQKKVVVRINDRGPFIRGRHLDLTTGAARIISMRGVQTVCISYK